MRRKLHRHDLSCEHDFSGNMGQLIPTHVRMCYPGDVVRQRSDFLVRVSPMLAPIISKVMIKAESFFVATDIIWENAQEFYSRGQDGTSTRVIPKYDTAGGPLPDGVGGLWDHIGVDPISGGVASRSYNILPIRAYNAIVNWHYNDQDLSTPRTISLADGPDSTTTLTLAMRCWERDRFTTARLDPQRGDDVLIPMGGTGDLSETEAPVEGIGTPNAVNFATTNSPTLRRSGQGSTGVYNPYFVAGEGQSVVYMEGTPGGGTGAIPYVRTNLTGITADIDPGTIRELGEAVAIDRFRRRLQTADGSYPDYTLATFGIRSPDIELQKPVLLARSSSPLQISEVLQTSQFYDSSDDPVGNPVGEMAGHGIATAQGHGFKYRVKKHGYIMTIFSVVPKTMYVQAADKEFFRETAEDYYDPDLDQIGEELITNKEVYLGHSVPDGDFGYQFRNYCDRSSLHRISGEMRTTLNYWHQARSFSSDVALNGTFVTSNPTDRIFALGSTVNQLRVKAMHDVKMLRQMRRIPMRGVL